MREERRSRGMSGHRFRRPFRSRDSEGEEIVRDSYGRRSGRLGIILTRGPTTQREEGKDRVTVRVRNSWAVPVQLGWAARSVSTFFFVFLLLHLTSK
jgi:hypothetical protein